MRIELYIERIRMIFLFVISWGKNWDPSKREKDKASHRRIWLGGFDSTSFPKGGFVYMWKYARGWKFETREKRSRENGWDVRLESSENLSTLKILNSLKKKKKIPSIIQKCAILRFDTKKSSFAISLSVFSLYSYLKPRETRIENFLKLQSLDFL